MRAAMAGESLLRAASKSPGDTMSVTLRAVTFLHGRTREDTRKYELSKGCFAHKEAAFLACSRLKIRNMAEQAASQVA